MRVVWSVGVRIDLDTIYEYICVDNPAAAAEVFDTIYEYAQAQLVAYPYAGHEGKAPNTRELVIPRFRNYVVVYELHEQMIEIVAVMHGKKNWPQSFHRPR